LDADLENKTVYVEYRTFPIRYTVVRFKTILGISTGSAGHESMVRWMRWGRCMQIFPELLYYLSMMQQ
jgi:hypothetical protein